MPGASSLFALLQQHYGLRTKVGNTILSVAQILNWAKRHRRRFGKWPKIMAGPILGAPGETWQGIDKALRRGERGLPGGDSLPRLLRQHQAEQKETDD